LSTQIPNSRPPDMALIVSTLSMSRLLWVSKHVRPHDPRISPYPRCASFRVVWIADAAGLEGCVAGKGRVRRNFTSGLSCESREGENVVRANSGPPGGVPEEPSATNLVYNCTTFLAPVSTIRA
jgi:hypothetical protein